MTGRVSARLPFKLLVSLERNWKQRYSLPFLNFVAVYAAEAHAAVRDIDAHSSKVSENLLSTSDLGFVHSGWSRPRK